MCSSDLKDYWEVDATFRAAAGEYTGRWLDDGFKKDPDDAHKRAERIWEQAKADGIRAKCDGQAGEVSEQSKPTKQAAAALFDLTPLQREANAKFGFSARNTLGIAQALYERHKVLTYPRTDSRCLPEDYVGTVKQTLESLGQARYGKLASDVLKNDWVHGGNKKVFNNAKISDHFAIIPTLKPAPGTLKEQEQKIYGLVAKRFIAVFYPSAEFLVTTRITRVEGEPFKTEGKVLVKPGWLTVYGRDQTLKGAGHLVPVATGESVQAAEVSVEAKATRPPARFTEATLLGAMEHAGKRIDDEELREAMSDKGLGTPATRASIIEELIRHTDRDRHFTILFEPLYLRNYQDVLVPEEARPFFNLFIDWFGEDVSTVAWSLHLGKDQFHSEMLLRNGGGGVSSPRRVHKEFDRRLDELPREVLGAVSKMNPERLGFRRIIGRFPAMVKGFSAATTGGIGDRYVQLTTVLPERAAPNLAVGLSLTWAESLRTDFTKAAPDLSKPKLPDLLADRLKAKIEIDFRRTPLHEAFTYIFEEAHVKHKIDGDALKNSTMTQNMTQDQNLGVVPAIDAIYAILGKYKREGMCVVVDEGAKLATVTSLKWVEENGIKESSTVKILRPTGK